MVAHCLGKGGAHASQPHIIMLLDCADISRVSADLMLRQSPRHFVTCGACAQICEACAEDCEKLDPQDEEMKRCAEICRRCAELCREMSHAKAA
jgi:hypothetical protein